MCDTGSGSIANSELKEKVNLTRRFPVRELRVSHGVEYWRSRLVDNYTESLINVAARPSSR